MKRGRTSQFLLSTLMLLLACGSLGSDPTTPDDAVRVRHLPLQLVEKKFASGQKVTGWQLNTRWYFGHANGSDNVGFVWQQRATQMSIGSEGFRWSRRF